jgi:menaquinol-cytochrome c reductase iron-sulfur subunit
MKTMSEEINGAPPCACAAEEDEPTRRAFYIRAVYAMGAAISAALAVPAAVYLLARPRTRQESAWADAGDVSSLTPGQPVEVAFRRNRTDGWKVVSEKLSAWVVKGKDGRVTAFGPQCTHLGCAYHWEERQGQFVCPCHNSLFSIDGKVLTGPAPRPLDRYEVRMEGSKLLVGAIVQNPENAG